MEMDESEARYNDYLLMIVMTIIDHQMAIMPALLHLYAF